MLLVAWRGSSETFYRRGFQSLLGFRTVLSGFRNLIGWIVLVPQLLKRADGLLIKVRLLRAAVVKMRRIIHSAPGPIVIPEDGSPCLIVLNIDGDRTLMR